MWHNAATSKSPDKFHRHSLNLKFSKGRGKKKKKNYTHKKRILDALPSLDQKIQRLNFDRREVIHGERREIDWTVCRSLSQWAHFGSFKRLDQPEMPLAHRINDFRLPLAKH